MYSKLIKFFFLFIAILSYTACSNELAELPSEDERTVWTGPKITFEKADGADPTQTANQDQLTSNVALTRGNDGGQIFNILQENESDKDLSPRGTQWAVGSIGRIDELEFQSFRETIMPSEVVGQELVLFLVEDNIFLSVEFTQWSNNKAGGFAYERATE